MKITINLNNTLYELLKERCGTYKRSQDDLINEAVQNFVNMSHDGIPEAHEITMWNWNKNKAK